MVKERSHWWDFVKTMTTRNMRFLRPGRFTPAEETRFPFYRRTGEFQDRSRLVCKISRPHPLGFEPRIVQPVASHTDYTTPASIFLRPVDRGNFLTSRITVYTSVSVFDISSCYLEISEHTGPSITRTGFKIFYC